MRGHLRERSPGHWAIVIDVRDPDTGKRKRRWHTFAGHQAAGAGRARPPDLRAAGRHPDRSLPR